MLVPLVNSDKCAIVDDEWEEDLLGNGQKWHLQSGYAATCVEPRNTFPGYRRIFLHNLIMGEKPSYQVDHINGNRLDNRTTNLRFVTKSQQGMNSAVRSDNASGCKGVFQAREYHGHKRRWRAQITVNGRQKRLGWFETFDEACAARKRAEQELHGEYARKE